MSRSGKRVNVCHSVLGSRRRTSRCPLYGLNARGEQVWTNLVDDEAHKDIRYRLTLTKTKRGYHDTKKFVHDVPILGRRAQRLPHVLMLTVQYQDNAALTAAAKKDILEAVRQHAPENVAKVSSQIERAFAAANDRVMYVVLPDDTYFRFHGECDGCRPIGELRALPK